MKNKPKIAIIRGKYLNKYEMQSFEPLIKKYDITAFGSLTPFHSSFAFPIVSLPSPMDLPDFPFKMPILNRLFIDAHYLFGLEDKLKGFDIAHSAETYYHYTQQALNAKKKGYVKKVILTVLENIPFNNEGIWRRKEFKKRTRQEADFFIALTNRTKSAMLLEGVEESKIEVISHGIDTKRFYPSKKNGRGSREINIMFSGRLEDYKGVFDILYAAKILINDKSLDKYRIQFNFVGEGSQRASLIALEKKLKISNFVKHKSISYLEIPKIYRQADIFVAPSKPAKFWVEQYNTAILEAQASGLPIITTMNGGIPENVGDAAILVGPGDYFALASQLKTFIQYPQKRVAYGKKSRQRALNVHDVRIIAKKIENLYEKVLNE